MRYKEAYFMRFYKTSTAVFYRGAVIYICISYCYTKNLLFIGYRKHIIDLKYLLMNEFSFIMACCACLDGLFSSSVEIQSMGKRPQNDS